MMRVTRRQASLWLLGLIFGALLALSIYWLTSGANLGLGVPAAIACLIIGALFFAYWNEWISIAAYIAEHRRAEEGQQQRDAILEAVAFAAERFLMTPDWQAHIDAVLERLGQQTNSSHVYIFENHLDPDGALVTSMRYEWAAPGIPPDIDNPTFQAVPIYHPDFMRWAKTLLQGQLFQGNLKTFLPIEAEILVPRGIKALLDVPIVVDGVWWGIIGFDDYKLVREWSQAEIEALKIAAGIISAAIQRQRADHALRESERRYRGAIEAAGAVPYYQEYGPDHDPGNDTSVYTFMSEGIRRLTGFGPGEVTPQVWDTLVQEMVILGEGAGLSPEEAIGRALTGDMKVWQCDYRIRTRDGQTRWIADTAVEIPNERGLARASIGILQDITDRKRIENELRLSEERYRLVSSVISDYTFSYMLDEHGQFRLNWVTGAFETISGYGLEEFVDRGGWLATVHPDDNEQNAQDMEKLRDNQRVVSELRVFHKDCSARWVRVYAHPVWDAEREQLAGIYGAIQDITDRKRAETEREHLISELEARNAELERFTYTVSHDLKSPLITIGGFLGFLEKDALSGNIERLQADIRRIKEAADTMRRLLDDLLELSRIGRLINPAQQVPFAQIVREALALVEGQLTARGVEVTVAADLPSVYGDRARLVEALQNLLDNAAKFMGDQPQPHIIVGVRAQAVERVLYVQDNGIGIDPKYHQKVFGLFEKLDAAATGTGIGLALVNRIVEVHGGRIWVESNGPGQGTAFCFTLPEQPAQSHM
jgi:PAS domain S-box-containing protein